MTYTLYLAQQHITAYRIYSNILRYTVLTPSETLFTLSFYIGDFFSYNNKAQICRNTFVCWTQLEQGPLQ